MRMSIERFSDGYFSVWARNIRSADKVRAYSVVSGIVLSIRSVDNNDYSEIVFTDVSTAECAAAALACVIEGAKKKLRPTCVRCDDVMPDAACGHLCSKCLAREGKFCIRCGRIMAADTKKAVCPKCLADDDVDGLGEGNEI